MTTNQALGRYVSCILKYIAICIYLKHLCSTTYHYILVAVT